MQLLTTACAQLITAYMENFVLYWQLTISGRAIDDFIKQIHNLTVRRFTRAVYLHLIYQQIIEIFAEISRNF